MSARRGAASLAEVLLVAMLLAVVLAGIARFAAAKARLVAAQRDRVRIEEVTRTVAVVLAAELRFLAGADIVAMATDSLRIRAFRGGGAVCDAAGAVVWVRYRGVRLPEPAKDSVLLAGSGPETALELVGSAGSDRCGGSRRLDLGSDAMPGARYVLVFETGSYALQGAALRYRRGAGGRQPLTEAVLRDPAFTLEPGVIRARIEPDPDSLPGRAGDLRWVRISPRNLGGGR